MRKATSNNKIEKQGPDQADQILKMIEDLEFETPEKKKTEVSISGTKPSKKEAIDDELEALLKETKATITSSPETKSSPTTKPSTPTISPYSKSTTPTSYSKKVKCEGTFIGGGALKLLGYNTKGEKKYMKEY